VNRTRILILACLILAAAGGSLLAQTGNGHAEPVNTGSLFSDVPVDHWAYEDLTYLAERGIITGLPGGRFDGDTALTRYDAVALIARAIQYMQNNSGVTPADLDVLKDLIFALSDDLDAVAAEVSALQAGGSSELVSRVAQNEQRIAQLQNQVQDSGGSSDSNLARRVQANLIISLTALLVGIIGVALATLGL